MNLCQSLVYLKYSIDFKEFEPRSGEVYSIQHYVIKFVSDLRQVDGFLCITEILLKVVLNTISLKKLNYKCIPFYFQCTVSRRKSTFY